MATTISLSNEMKECLKNLGRAGESYEDVIRRMYELTKKQLMLQYLYDTSDSFTIDEFRKELKNG
jgi:predicted CopG family antitoxin